MIDTAIIDTWLLTRPSKPVDVIIVGRILGGRHGEAMQVPKGYTIHDRKLIMFFGTTETLVVDRPEGVKIGKECGELIIPHAREVLWGWHYYGRGMPHAPENWCTMRYSLTRNGMVGLATRGRIARHLSRPNEIFRYTGDEVVKLC